jgi:hypothetical protein
MNNKFRCGRLTLTRDGQIEEVNLANGGGVRFCDWSDDMTMNDVHHRLKNIFDLGNLVKTYISS